MIPLFKRQRPSSVLGIALDGNRLEVVSLRRANGAIQLRQAFAAALALSPLTDAPELVGQEIRNHLDRMGVQERRCVVCLPLSWVLNMQSHLPEMSEEDRGSFLQIEAERGFHSGPEDLFTRRSFFKTPSGESYATLLAAPRNQLASLENVLRAAKLKPLAFALGVTALQPAAAEPGRVLLLSLRNNSLDLQITGGGGIVALRSLDGAIETQGAQKSVSAEVVAREIRITLGQLPNGLAEGPGKLKIVGQGDLARQLVDDLNSRVGPLGLRLEVLDKACNASFDKSPPPEIAASQALALAANYVQGADAEPDFLPPKERPWQQLVSTRLSPRKLAWAGAGAGAVVLCVAGAFGVQQWQIVSLQSKWNRMEPNVNELTADQDQIQKFAPWYDKSGRDMLILGKLAEAFQHDGGISAKKVEIHDVSGVTCSGVARDNAAFSRLYARLGDDTTNISNLHAETHGQKPMDFTVTFQWGGGQANGQ